MLRLLAVALLFAAGVTYAVDSGSVPNALTNVSAASFQGPAGAPGALMAAFGANLSTSTEAAVSTPLPQSLAGTSVKVTDSAGVERSASLLYVSPGQVNYLLPDQLAEGAAVVAVVTGQGARIEGPLLVKKAAPGLFAANGDGKGVASAMALRFTAENAQTTSPVWRGDQLQGKCVTAPIDIGSTTDRVFLSLYGTGIRNAATVNVMIDGVAAPVTWKGPHSVYAGLDQVNVELPRVLQNRGPVAMVLVADGVEANPVTIDVLGRQYLNLDFETNLRGQVRDWTLTGSGYEFAADTSVAHSGQQSLRIRNLTAVAPAYAEAYQAFPLDAVRGRHLRFSGFIKTEGIHRGWAVLTCIVTGVSSSTSVGAFGATDWKQDTTECDVGSDATAVYLGVLQTGDGTAWFDSLTVEIDGLPYQPGPVPSAGEPLAAQLDWVRQNAIPFSTPLAGTGLEELGPVKDVVGNAHIVGLGEGTHGTSEFFRMKHKLLEYLATEMGFTIFAIEANMPEAYKVNDYVLYGRGDPKQLLKGMYFWTWNTQEVLDMIEWMRQFNASGKGPIQFTGFDMQTATVAMTNVRSFAGSQDPAYLATVNAVYAQAQSVISSRTTNTGVVTAAAAAARGVWQHLDQHRADYLPNSSGYDVDWAIQNGRIVEQAVYYQIGGTSYRDTCMAQNFDWIMGQAPAGTKTVIWAHDYHVSRTTGAMGSYLADTHGKDYLVMGQFFHAGRYNAVGSYGLTAYDAAPSFAGSAEYVFHSTEMPRFILDMRKASYEDPASAWLRDEIEYRTIGAVVEDGFLSTLRFTTDYDALVFFDQTTPSALLPF